MRFINCFLQLIFPENVACFACDKPACTDEYGLCEECAAKIIIPKELEKPAHVDGITAGLVYDGTLTKAMHKFKYSGAGYLGRQFARFIELPKEWPVTCIIPVPLHEKRKKQRGYNQSALVARELGKRYGLPVYEDMLSRVRDTQSQTHLSKQERIMNVSAAFMASKGMKSSIPLIVDDVLTTGSTLSACAAAAKEAGAKEVYAAAACVAPAPAN